MREQECVLKETHKVLESLWKKNLEKENIWWKVDKNWNKFNQINEFKCQK